MDRSARTKIVEWWLRVRDRVWRGIYLLGVVAFLLPFVTVKGCGSDADVRDYYGFQLITEDFENIGWAFFLPVCIGLTFLALSFIHRRYGQILQGFLKGWRAVFASFAAFVVLFGPYFLFLFNELTPRIGWYLGATCWSLVYLGSLVGAFAHFWTVGRSRASPVYGTSWGIVSLRALHYLVAVYAVAHPLVYFGTRDPSWIPISLIFLSIPAFLPLHFAAEGIRIGERWAIAWGVSFSFLLLAGGVTGSALAIRANAPVRLITFVLMSCFAAVAFAGALSTIRTYGRTRVSVQSEG